MPDKTNEQIAKEQAAVAAMRNARNNMDEALKRIGTLESALNAAIINLRGTKAYVGASACIYGTNQAKTVHSLIEEQVAAAQKVLG